MNATITLRHHPVDSQAACEEMERTFGQRTYSPQRFARESKLFKDLAFGANLIFGNRFLDTFYAFLHLGPGQTQLWIECSTGRETLQHICWVADRGMCAIKAAQRARVKGCAIQASRLYETVDTDALPLTIVHRTRWKRLGEAARGTNIAALLTTYALALAFAWFTTPPAERSISLALTHGAYAPAGAVVAVVIVLAYNALRVKPRVGVIVEET